MHGNKAKRPTKGSVAILNASAVKGSFTSGLRETSSPVSGFVPFTIFHDPLVMARIPSHNPAWFELLYS
jgi:hypothetical protein